MLTQKGKGYKGEREREGETNFVPFPNITNARALEHKVARSRDSCTADAAKNALRLFGVVESEAFRRAVSGESGRRVKAALRTKAAAKGTTASNAVSRELLPKIFSRHSAFSLRKVSGLHSGFGLLQLAEESAPSSTAPRRVVIASVGRYEEDGSISSGRHMVVIDTGEPITRTGGGSRAPLIVDGDEGRETSTVPFNEAGIRASYFTGQVSWCREVLPKHVQGKNRPLPEPSAKVVAFLSTKGAD